MQEYSDFENERIYNYFTRSVDSIMDRTDMIDYTVGPIFKNNDVLSATLNCNIKKPRSPFELDSYIAYIGGWSHQSLYARRARYYCTIDTKYNNIVIKDPCDKGKLKFKGKIDMDLKFSDFVYGKVKKGILKIPFKL